MSSCTYVVADVRDALAALPDGSVDLVLTSPPFLALRSYLPADHPDKHREIGSEPTPAAFLDTLLGLSAEWRRVLTDHGTLAVELGDTYAGSTAGGGDHKPEGEWTKYKRGDLTDAASIVRKGAGWPLDKSLSLIPEAYRMGLAYGRNPLTGTESPAGQWRIRNVIRWVRPNPPVGALGDKFRPATSDLVIACTSRTRWFDLDAVRAPVSEWTKKYADGYPESTVKKAQDQYLGKTAGATSAFLDGKGVKQQGAPPLDWWSIPPGGYRGSHYAVFPPELCRRPIQAMCPRRVCRTCGAPSRREAVTVEQEGRPVITKRPGAAVHKQTVQATTGKHLDHAERETTGWSTCGCPGTDRLRLDGWHRGTGWRPGLVLDPFAGSGTTLLVAHSLGRSSIGFDLDPRNLHLARERIGLWLEEQTLSTLKAAS